VIESEYNKNKELLTMTREELIKHYERHLEKVKCMHNPERETTCLMKERCLEYIKCAENDLQEVINGREW
jgi:protoporphyrinogen oxidase